MVSHKELFTGTRRNIWTIIGFWYLAELRKFNITDHVARTDCVDSGTRCIAEKFTSYSQLGWFGRWELRHFLSWIRRDVVSTELLLSFEKKLQQKPRSSKQIVEIIIHALTWYNREDHDNRLHNRIQHDRLPEMLQIVTVFLEGSCRLHSKYRELVLNILHASDHVRKSHEIGFGVTPEQFQHEVAKVISSLSQQFGQQWRNWLPHLRDEADRTIGYLEKIADKVKDSQQFTMVCQDMAPAIGLKATSTIMVLSGDFREFEANYHRVTAQLKWWGVDYKYMFSQFQSASELDQILVFLESLTLDPRMAKCVRCAEMLHYSRVQLLPMDEVKGLCFGQEWRRISECSGLIDRAIDKFEQNIVHNYLRTTWSALTSSRRIRWEFDKFTEYIPYAMRTQDWTEDNEKTRPYWSYGKAAGLELDRFVDALKPRLCSIFKELDISEIEILFSIIPSYLGIQEFMKTVKIPVEWEKGIESAEGYNKYEGCYTTDVEVARPKGFIEHAFTFERPCIENAIDLLDNMVKIREAIQAHRNSKH